MIGRLGFLELNLVVVYIGENGFNGFWVFWIDGIGSVVSENGDFDCEIGLIEGVGDNDVINILFFLYVFCVVGGIMVVLDVKVNLVLWLLLRKVLIGLCIVVGSRGSCLLFRLFFLFIVFL